MFDLNTKIVLIWIGIFVSGGFFTTYVIPAIFTKAIKKYFFIKYSSYFANKFSFEQIKQGKTLNEINNTITQLTKEKK